MIKKGGKTALFVYRTRSQLWVIVVICWFFLARWLMGGRGPLPAPPKEGHYYPRVCGPAAARSLHRLSCAVRTNYCCCSKRKGCCRHLFSRLRKIAWFCFLRHPYNLLFNATILFLDVLLILYVISLWHGFPPPLVGLQWNLSLGSGTFRCNQRLERQHEQDKIR